MKLTNALRLQVFLVSVSFTCYLAKFHGCLATISRIDFSVECFEPIRVGLVVFSFVFALGKTTPQIQIRRRHEFPLPVESA